MYALVTFRATMFALVTKFRSVILYALSPGQPIYYSTSRNDRSAIASSVWISRQRCNSTTG